MNDKKHMDDDSSQTEAKEVEKISIAEEMEQSYIDYAMSVIEGRALPDVRDGLKPVQRRILYSMHKEGISSNGSHRKSSSVVGETMGNFHPHGDSAIYDALARMAQDFSLREPLVDGQGNYGSMDGDSPAAMRYTEARLSEYGELLLEDMDEDTVPWADNYDGRMQEPEVLPAAFPNLLVNGSSGIAVGMSTQIPPHNLNEVIDATVHLIENPDCDVEDLLKHVKGPDFPTGGEIVYNEGVEKAYKKGNGTIKVRASYEVEEDRIVITELPYQKRKKKSAIVKKLADMVRDGELDGVRDLRDESNREGISIVIELKQDAIPEVIENKLIDKKVLQNNFSVINLALVDGQPRILDLKETLVEYVKHRKSVIRRRTEKRLAGDKKEAHLKEGKIIALDNVDEVVSVIRGEETRDDAVSELVEQLELTQEQAESIVRMQLGSLTSMEKEDVRSAYQKLEDNIEYYEEILENEENLLQVVKEELLDVKEEYGDERKTKITFDENNVEYEDLIPEGNMVITLTESGYVKRTSVDEFRTQKRGGKGIIGMKTKNGDYVDHVLSSSTHDRLLIFTDKGQVYSLKCYNLPQSGRNSRGRPMHSIIEMDKEEEIDEILVHDESMDYLNMVTRKGLVKKTPLEEYNNIYNSGIKAIDLNDGDRIADTSLCNEGESLLITTKGGKSIRFQEEDVRSVSRNAKGVKGIELDEDDMVVSINRVEEEKEYLLTITENGYGKKTPIEEFGIQSRAGKGYINIVTDERNGDTINSYVVSGDDSHILLVSDSGRIIRFGSNQVSTSGRNTKGVKLMDCDSLLTSHSFIPE